MQSISPEILDIGCRARAAARLMATLPGRLRQQALAAMAGKLTAAKVQILEANRCDLAAARQNGLEGPLLKRLEISEKVFAYMRDRLTEAAALPDPVGRILEGHTRPNGLHVERISVPIGVIGIIYESRPNVTADSAGLCFKTSNAVILRGGKEAMNSNLAIVTTMVEGGTKKGLPRNAIQFITTTDREAIRELVQLEGRVDLAIPRGGEALIRSVTEHARIPVIKHYKGVCHTYIDESANLDMALAVAENAKCQRPGVCNALETLLVHEKVAGTFLPRLAARFTERGVELRGCPVSRKIVPEMKEATEDDWYAEYLDLILAVRVVPSVKAAVEHINRYGSHHSDAIIAESKTATAMFTQEVDSATVYVNASTRFTDGGEFGMGAEIGISTDKLHARGPMGLEELTTYKYVIYGNGQIRQ